MKQAASKTTHKSAKKSNRKEQFSSMVKVVKPKVYITDSSSFKALVQELTGKGGELISSGCRAQEQRSTTSIPTQQIAHPSNLLDEVWEEERMSNSLSPLTVFTIEQTSCLVPDQAVQELATGQKNERLWSMEAEDPSKIFDDYVLDYFQEDEFLPCLESFDQLQDLYSIIHS